MMTPSYQSSNTLKLKELAQLGKKKTSEYFPESIWRKDRRTRRHIGETMTEVEMADPDRLTYSPFFEICLKSRDIQ